MGLFLLNSSTVTVRRVAVMPFVTRWAPLLGFSLLLLSHATASGPIDRETRTLRFRAMRTGRYVLTLQVVRNAAWAVCGCGFSALRCRSISFRDLNLAELEHLLRSLTLEAGSPMAVKRSGSLLLPCRREGAGPSLPPSTSSRVALVLRSRLRPQRFVVSGMLYMWMVGWRTALQVSRHNSDTG